MEDERRWQIKSMPFHKHTKLMPLSVGWEPFAMYGGQIWLKKPVDPTLDPVNPSADGLETA